MDLVMDFTIMVVSVKYFITNLLIITKLMLLVNLLNY